MSRKPRTEKSETTFFPMKMANQKPDASAFRLIQISRRALAPGSNRSWFELAIDWKWSSARHHVLVEMPQDPDLPRLVPFPPDLLG